MTEIKLGRQVVSPTLVGSISEVMGILLAFPFGFSAALSDSQR